MFCVNCSSSSHYALQCAIPFNINTITNDAKSDQKLNLLSISRSLLSTTRELFFSPLGGILGFFRHWEFFKYEGFRYVNIENKGELCISHDTHCWTTDLVYNLQKGAVTITFECYFEKFHSECIFGICRSKCSPYENERARRYSDYFTFRLSRNLLNDGHFVIRSKCYLYTIFATKLVDVEDLNDWFKVEFTFSNTHVTLKINNKVQVDNQQISFPGEGFPSQGFFGIFSYNHDKTYWRNLYITKHEGQPLELLPNLFTISKETNFVRPNDQVCKYIIEGDTLILYPSIMLSPRLYDLSKGQISISLWLLLGENATNFVVSIGNSTEIGKVINTDFTIRTGTNDLKKPVLIQKGSRVLHYFDDVAVGIRFWNRVVYTITPTQITVELNGKTSTHTIQNDEIPMVGTIGFCAINSRCWIRQIDISHDNEPPYGFIPRRLNFDFFLKYRRTLLSNTPDTFVTCDKGHLLRLLSVEQILSYNAGYRNGAVCELCRAHITQEDRYACPVCGFDLCSNCLSLKSPVGKPEYFSPRK